MLKNYWEKKHFFFNLILFKIESGDNYSAKQGVLKCTESLFGETFDFMIIIAKFIFNFFYTFL